MRQRRVLVVQERLPHYRVPFFVRLRERLADDGIELVVAHGRGDADAAARGDEASLPGAMVVDNRRVGLAGGTLVWQPVLRLAAGADLVVVEQASRMAVNYPLLARQALGGPKVAFWGHGRNLQAEDSALHRVSEAAKARYSRFPHWWFAYTEGSARQVAGLGFPADRITVVQNAVDTAAIDATQVEREPWRCVYVGGLYPGKRLDLVLGAADALAAREPRLRQVIVGDGPLHNYVAAESARRPYVHYAGPAFGRELAVELKRSALMVLPAAVGLGVVDAFAAGLPVVTTSGRGHGPELEYVEPGRNGLVTGRSAAALADGIEACLDPATYPGLQAGCGDSAQRLSVASMVERFADGVGLALRPGAAARRVG